MSALDVLDNAIADLEARLNLSAGQEIPQNLLAGSGGGKSNKKNKGGGKQPKQQQQQQSKKNAEPNNDQPDICKLEFKVGQIVKVWVHPEADKLYCEEIDVGEESGPRQIASGLRPHFTEEQMLGQRLLVASNLKAKNLVGFKSHGMVLCAAKPDGEGEIVQFVEPPEGAAIGEVITFEGLPPPEPLAPNQVEKKKLWQKAAEGMKTTDDCIAAWNGHAFMTSAGPCRTQSVAGHPMR
mmetsp:Transcript_21037/g.43969  ORF Transcript_21037/g.43969 Transcript_21037/m.43969 type:complete len:238 (-) Transcript_21037:43-756(-)|eukprot:CAMPEP_0172442462 /NCGR_PEP_ID=MMETSP1065-20121228/2877_1 /TAXON_ID=265537 /ORGANISM="Amphiprora paludosa, Strain CCMP125" /LENGTH=237 /DNA_ID=CAMNT_0013192319 /DNA_START=114 /DNA_END=827 /DNA_ORIENTATION=+